MAKEYDPFDDGGTAAKFTKFKHKYSGTVLSWKSQQQTKLETGELQWWDEAKTRPKTEVMVEFQLAEGDPNWGKTWDWNGESWDLVELDEDDGIRTLWVKGGLWTAWKAAMRKAGIKTADLPGTHIDRVEYTSNGKSETKGYKPPKRFEVELTPGKPADPFDE